MRSDLTDITLVVDRSGSMSNICSDAQGGINAFIQRQAKEPGEALLTLVQFDTEYEFVHRAVPVGEVPEFELHPRGQTALLDAVGRGMHETGVRLAGMNEADRPGLVVFVIVTDGLENSSHEYSRKQIRDMIREQQSKYNWQFTFLGADQDAYAEAASMGIDAAGVANYSKCEMEGAWAGTASKVARMRDQAMLFGMVDNRFTAEELEAMQ